MPKTLVISINLGSGFAGLNLCAQVVKSNGSNITPIINDGFCEIGEGYYIWEYSNFPNYFRGGVKFYNQTDTSKVLSFIDVSTEDQIISTCNEECVPEIGSSFDITYSDQPGLNFYALLFSAKDTSKAWNPAIDNFEEYSLSNQLKFALYLQEDSNRPGWYSYNIANISNIPVVVGNEFYFIEVWQKKGALPNRMFDYNTGTLRVCWGAKNGEWLEIARRVWEYGTRTLTGFDGITPQQIWEYSMRTLTSGGGGGDCDYTQLEKNILNAISISTGKTIEEITKGDAALQFNLDKTFELLKTCCSSKIKNLPNVQSPRIGPRGSTGRGPDMRIR